MRVSSSRIGWTSRGSYMGAFRPGMALSFGGLHSNIIVRPHASADSRRRPRAGRAAARAPARAGPALSPARHRIADLEVDLGTRQVQRRGRPITLSAKEFALLELFVLNQGRVLDRGTITAHVWDDNHDPFANLLEVLVGRLRRKVDDGFEPKLIRTSRGAGYRFGP